MPFETSYGESLQVKFGFFSVGDGLMEVTGIDTIRGRESWHTLFRVWGGIPGFRVNDRFESWMDTHTLASLRHRQEIEHLRVEAATIDDIAGMHDQPAGSHRRD